MVLLFSSIFSIGTREEIRVEVKRLLDGCKKGGGYIFAPAHFIQADTSLENIEMFYEAAREFGGY